MSISRGVYSWRSGQNNPIDQVIAIAKEQKGTHAGHGQQQRSTKRKTCRLSPQVKRYIQLFGRIFILSHVLWFSQFWFRMKCISILAIDHSSFWNRRSHHRKNSSYLLPLPSPPAGGRSSGLRLRDEWSSYCCCLCICGEKSGNSKSYIKIRDVIHNWRTLGRLTCW